MPELQESIGSPVKEFIKSFLKEADEGLKEQGYAACSENQAHIKIELNATEVNEVGGGLKIHVFSLGSKSQDSNAQKMTIFAKKIDEAEEADRRARIEEAKAREAGAKLIQQQSRF